MRISPRQFPVSQKSSAGRFSLTLENSLKFSTATSITFLAHLFDSFILDFRADTGLAHLWVLQMTTACLYGGSAKGYVVIRKILEKIRRQFENTDTEHPDKPSPGKKQKLSVEVYYVFVRPANEPAEDEESAEDEDSPLRSVRWVLPQGWNKPVTRTDHRGEGYFLDISLSSTYL
ncbi:hypothetical protein APHAL10511_007824 [Amanita phalloides]|nr:hypothetical protein APHAL10511_007824 [Amanita phalloides]